MKLCGGGCRRAIPDDAKRCDECNAERNVTASTSDTRTHSNSYDEQLDAQRKSARWQRTRTRVLKRDPFCRRCAAAIAEICDHIVPAREAIAHAQVSGRFPLDKWAGYYLETNLQGLCRPCHALKTDEDKTHTGPWPDIIAAWLLRPKKVWSF
jgi:5-methylcytosine-specific restriction endonuclease McrA